jgi:hypothetical protein
MKAVNKIEIKIENIDKCLLILDSDCPLGQLYDFSCAVKSFVYQKMKEGNEQESQEQKA